MNSATTADQSPASYHTELPDRPLVVVEPQKSWVRLNLRDLWTYRELLYFLTWRDVKVRYKQTLLGATWAILQPLALMLIFNIVFGRLAGMKSGDVPYSLFAFAGLLPWTFFANAISNSGNSLVNNTNLITKVYFPRMLIPIASVAAGLVDLGIAFILMAVLMVYYGIGFHLNLLMLPVLILLATLLAIGVGMWMAALNVKYRDVRHALPFLVQIWMFSSPVIYSVPDNWRWVLAMNPMTGIIQGFRSALFGKPFDFLLLGVSTIITVFVLLTATISFRRLEKSFADVI